RRTDGPQPVAAIVFERRGPRPVRQQRVSVAGVERVRKMVVENASTDVVIWRKVPVRLDGELFVVLAGSTAGQRHHAEWITSARQHVLELEGYRRETGGRDLVSRERRLDDYLLTGVSASGGTREKASGVGIEYLPRVEI